MPLCQSRGAGGSGLWQDDATRSARPALCYRGNIMPDQTPAATRYLVILNQGAGTIRSRGVETVRASIGKGLSGSGAVDIRSVDGDGIDALVDDVLASGSADIIVVVGGGDGTVAAVAGKLAGTEVALAVLPLGTMNMVSQSAGFSQNLEQAVAQIASGQIKPVDVGRVNGRVFLHQVSFGLQPRVVRIRERIGYNSRLTKMLSGTVAMLAVLSRPRPVRMVGEFDGRLIRLKLTALFVSNNLYRIDRPRIPVQMDGGELGIYMVKAWRWRDYVRLVLAALRGTWQDDAMVDVQAVKALRLNVRRKASHGKQLASIDGELAYLESPIDIVSDHLALRLVMPPEAAKA